MPTTPKTRNGEAVMTTAQARYWSLTTYDPRLPDPDGFCGAVVNSFMDDEIVTDADGRFVIVYGRSAERPANATAANGVTWADCGPASRLGLTMRWMTIHPDWEDAASPNEGRLSWRGVWSARAYDPRVVDINDRRGFLGEYQPVIKYLTKEQFEALPSPVRPQDVPAPSVAQLRFTRLGTEVPQYDVVSQRFDAVSGSAAGVTQRLQYTISNVGSGSLKFTVAAVPYNFTNCTAQVVSMPAVGSSLASRGTIAAVLDITPTAAGAWNCSLTFTTDQNESVYRTVLITGTASAANATTPVPAALRDEIAIDTIDTVDGSLSDQPYTLTYRVVNGGTSTWSPGATTLTETGNCSLRIVTALPASIAAGDSADLVIEVIPKSADTWTGRVVNAGTPELSFNLRGVANQGKAVVTPTAPSISSQPLDRTVTVGQAATFTVQATGSQPINYRWQRAAATSDVWLDVAGAVSNQCITGAATTADDGSRFRVVVANGTAPDAVSTAAKLTVLPPASTTNGTTSATGGSANDPNAGATGCGIGTGLGLILMVIACQVIVGRRRR